MYIQHTTGWRSYSRLPRTTHNPFGPLAATAAGAAEAAGGPVAGATVEAADLASMFRRPITAAKEATRLGSTGGAATGGAKKMGCGWA